MFSHSHSFRLHSAFGAGLWRVLMGWLVFAGVAASGPKSWAQGAELKSEGGVRVLTEQQTWWAFQPISKPAVPVGTNDTWSANPIDRFIHAKLGDAGLEPGPRASKRVLVRRAFMDLTGLPPSEEEVLAFLSDATPQAFGNLVERLLASPRYGEKWGQHWMDVARYADTAGDNADYPVPEARLYRDYIIGAFNQDKPFAEFVTEQLAGDILASSGPRERYAERVAATGFLALSRRYATAPFELMHLTIEDAIETTGRAFLGMTLRCARCHDHKYDPVSSREYYGLYGVFASTRFPYAGSEEFQSKNLPRTGFVPLRPEAEVAEEVRANAVRVAELKEKLKRLEGQLEQSKTNSSVSKPDMGELTTTRAELKRRDRFASAPGVPVAYAVAESTPVDETIHKRGDPGDRGPAVARCAPGFLGVGGELRIPKGSSGRREFAEWLVRKDHPLTARVLVNRVWQHHFGRGLVATASNFGLRGEKPSHPELLDYLAARFLESGGSIKALHRLIVCSATWQQAWRPATAAAEQRDPANTLLWRHDRRRLDAEGIRDTLMSVAGTLDLTTLPGPHPFPEFEAWNWTQHTPFKAVYETSKRSVYLMRQRIQRHPYLALFDAPDANVSTDVRTSATLPPQALFLMNNPFVRVQANAFANRLIASARTDADRIRNACAWAWGRPPEPSEDERLRQYVVRYTEETIRSGVGRREAEREAWRSVAQLLLISNETLYVD